MAAYIVVRADVRDWDAYREHMRHTPRVIARFGERFIVRGGETVTPEGPEDTRRPVVIEFPRLQHGKEFYESEEYQEAKKIREGGGEARSSSLSMGIRSRHERRLLRAAERS